MNGKSNTNYKAHEEPVPISGYDAFMAIARIQDITDSDLKAWTQQLETEPERAEKSEAFNGI